MVTVAAFVTTWVVPESPLGTDEAKTRAAVEYWRARPYLVLSEDFTAQLIGPGASQAIAQTRRVFDTVRSTPPDVVVRTEQARLDVLTSEALGAIEPTWFRALALAPARGWLQPGWLTHIALHVSWLHLAVNLLFLYAVALLLEEAWGTARFLVLFLAGGVLSAIAQVSLARDTAPFLVGASGAVAACIGAAMVGFHHRSMRMLSVLPWTKRVITVPVWWWGVFLGAFELFRLFTGLAPGVAVLGHLAGLAFGVMVGTSARLKEASAPAPLPIEAEVDGVAGTVADGQRALLRGDAITARLHFERALGRAPRDVDAQWGLFDVELAEGHPQVAAGHLERIVQQALRSGAVDLARSAFLRGFKALAPRDLRTAFALSMARTFGNTLPRDVTRALWTRVEAEGGPEALLAAVVAAELALEAGDLATASPLVERIHGLAGDAGELAPRVRAVIREHERLAAEDRAFDDEPPSIASQRTIFPASVATVAPDHLELSIAGGGPKTIARAEIKAVAAGLATVGDHHRALCVFLVLDWGRIDRPAVLVRIDSDGGGVERCVSATSIKDAYTSFLAALLEPATVQAIPSRPRLLSGDFPTAGTVQALEQSLFAPLV